MVEPTEKEEKIQVYVSDAMRMAVAVKGHAMMSDNMLAYASSQGAINILLDIQALLNGGNIASLAEVEKEVKKAKEQKAKESGYIS